jgi:hypothetical protein
MLAIADSVKKDLVDTIENAGDVVETIVDNVRVSLLRALRGTRDVGDEVSDFIIDTVAGVVRGAAETVALGETARGTVIGVLRATWQTGGEAADMVAMTSNTLVKKTFEIGGDIGETVKGAVEGAIEGAKAVGLDAEKVASAAAAGALKAASEIGSIVVDEVQRVATGTGIIMGVRVAARAPFDLR